MLLPCTHRISHTGLVAKSTMKTQRTGLPQPSSKPSPVNSAGFAYNSLAGDNAAPASLRDMSEAVTTKSQTT